MQSLRGFTLIELMIVVAIIGILSAISVTAYQDYVTTANIARVKTHFEGGCSAVRNELSKVGSKLGMSAAASNEAASFATAADLIGTVINPDDRLAPSGGLAYQDGAPGPDFDRQGVVAVPAGDFTGPTSASNWSEVRVKLVQPQYEGLEATSCVIEFINL